MQTEKEVIKKANELYERFLSRKLEDFLTTSYHNCKYNNRHRIRGTGMVGFCTCCKLLEDKNQPVFVCNDDDVAKACNFYECKHTKETVIQEYKEEISSPSVCGQRYPKLAVLLWVLQQMSDEQPSQVFTPKPKTRFQRLSTECNVIWKSLLNLVLFRWM